MGKRMSLGSLTKLLSVAMAIGIVFTNLGSFLDSLEVNLGYVELAGALLGDNVPGEPGETLSGGNLVQTNPISISYSPDRLRGAEAHFRRVLARTPESILAIWGTGRVSWIQGDYESAAETFLQATQLGSNHRIMRLFAGHALVLAGEKEQGIEYWRQAVGPSLDAQFKLADRLLRSGMPMATMALASQLLDVSQTSQQEAEAHGLIGKAIYSSDGDMSVAMMHLGQAVDLEPDNSEWHLWLGRIWYRDGDVQQSIAEARLAAALNPQYWKVHKDLGLYYLKLGMLDEAIEEYKLWASLVRGLQNEYAAHFYLGEVYWQRGLKNLAVSEWEQALELNPEFQEAQGRIDQARE